MHKIKQILSPSFFSQSLFYFPISRLLAKGRLFTNQYCLAVLWLSLGLAPLQANSNPTVSNLDHIIAVVDQSIILSSEVNERIDLVYKKISGSGSRLPPRHLLEEQVLDRMILESIQLQMAENLGIRVDDDAVTQAIENIAKNNNQNLDQFYQTMVDQSVDFAQFRRQIRRELIISKLQQRIVSQRVKVSDQDVNNFLASPLAKDKLAAEYRLYHLLISAPEDSKSKQEKALQQINEIKRLIETQELSFHQAALTYSDGQNAHQGGDMGWRKVAQMPSLFAEAVGQLRKGQLSEPIKSGAGYHLLLIANERGNTVKNLEQTHVRHILVSPNTIRNSEQTQALIEDIFDQLMGGAAFENVARTYSDDTTTARKGGDLGWVTPNTMVASFENVMNSQPVGAITRPFQTQYGWHILEVLARRSEDVSETYKEASAKQMIFRRKFDEELDSWLQEIRHNAFVELRTEDG